MNYLGIDWGEKRVGLAIGNSETKIATPYGVVNDLISLKKVIEDEEIEKLIVGKPIKMSGEEKLEAEFSNFISELKYITEKQIEFIDERLSSKAADALIGDKKTKAPRDAVAAMLILQSYFDKNKIKK